MPTADLVTSPNLDVDVTFELVSGDLHARGWEREKISVTGSHPSIKLLKDKNSNHINVTCQGDAKLKLPGRASLKIETIAGDARISELSGAISVRDVSGDLVARDVGAVTVDHIASDLRVRRINGALDVKHVGADATVRDIEGDVHIDTIGADLFLGNVTGSCIVEHVGADLVLNIPFSPEHDYRFNAGSDVVCKVLPSSSVRFLLPHDVKVNIKAEGAKQSQDEEYQIVTFGTGETAVYIQAGGRVRLVRRAEEGEGEGIKIDLDLDFEWLENIASLEERLNEQLADLDKRLCITVARQTEKVEKQAERLRRQAEKRISRMQKAAARRAKKEPRAWTFVGSPSPPPPAPSPPPAPVSDEERMTILHMLEGGKINVDEAERLLAALEGRTK